MNYYIRGSSRWSDDDEVPSMWLLLDKFNVYSIEIAKYYIIEPYYMDGINPDGSRGVSLVPIINIDSHSAWIISIIYPQLSEFNSLIVKPINTSVP